MNRRLVLFILCLVLLSAAVLYLVTIVLPGSRVYGWLPLSARRTMVPAAPGARLPSILAVPLERPLIGDFWLRPFGLHRPGLFGVLWYLGSLATVAILALITLLVLPQRIAVLAQVVSNGWDQRLLAFAFGVMGYLGSALLAFMIFINVVGWPVLLVLLLAVYLATCLGLVAMGLALGTQVSRLFRLDDRSPLFNLCVGVVLLFLVSIVPYLGWLVAAIAGAMGFGAVLWTRAGSAAGWSLDEVQTSL